jgi:hypothetical protein
MLHNTSFGLNRVFYVLEVRIVARNIHKLKGRTL